MCIVQISNFPHLEIYKIHREWYIDLKFTRVKNELLVLQSMKVSHLSVIPDRFCKSSKLKNWMCKLCTFSQIQLHNLLSQSQGMTKINETNKTLMDTCLPRPILGYTNFLFQHLHRKLKFMLCRYLSAKFFAQFHTRL